MIAILVYDGDGDESIIAVLENEEYIDSFIKKYTGFIPKGFVKKSKYNEYWCKKIKTNKEGILIQTSH